MICLGTPQCAQAIAKQYHGRLGPMAIVLLSLSAIGVTPSGQSHLCRGWAIMRHAKEVFVLQMVFQISRTVSMANVCTGRKTKIRMLRCLVLFVNDLAVSAVVDGKLIGVLWSHVMVRGRSVQAEDPTSAEARRSPETLRSESVLRLDANVSAVWR